MFRFSPITKTMNPVTNFSFLPAMTLFLWLLCGLSCLSPAQEKNNSIRIRPESGSIGKGSLLTVYFNDAVVTNESIDREGEQCPLVFEPEMTGDFTWKSQTEGQFLVTGHVIPGQRYKDDARTRSAIHRQKTRQLFPLD